MTIRISVKLIIMIIAIIMIVISYVYFFVFRAVAVEPELQVMIKEQQDKLRKEYEAKLAGLVRICRRFCYRLCNDLESVHVSSGEGKGDDRRGESTSGSI